MAEVTVNPASVRRAFAGPIREVIESVLFGLRAQIIRLFGGRKSGRVYPRPKPARGTYRASAPGQPPAIASGNLLRKISQPRLVSPFEGVLEIDTPYVKVLEGIELSPHMAPRPFVRPALETVKSRFKSVRRLF